MAMLKESNFMSSLFYSGIFIKKIQAFYCHWTGPELLKVQFTLNEISVNVYSPSCCSKPEWNAKFS